jgi:hypothetical protein
VVHYQRIKICLFLATACLFLTFCSAQTKSPPKMKAIEVGGMRINWHFEDEKLIVEAVAPDVGWIGIGFNPKDDIVQTNLIMSGVSEGKNYLSERYVVGMGNHKSVASLGGKEVVKILEAEEKNGSTRVRFSIPCASKDRFHYDLHEGTEIYFICAFSMEDDLTHHSRMRQHVKVKL